MIDYIEKNPEMITLIVVSAAFLVFAVISLVKRRSLENNMSLMERTIEMSTKRVVELTDAMELRQDRLRGVLDEKMEALRSSNDIKLDQIRSAVTGKLDTRLGESFRTVNEQLARVDKGLGEMRTLAGDVVDLKKVLTNSRARGMWGEVQLGSLISEMLTPDQYLENTPVVSGSAERVEFAIVLPSAAGDTALLPVDSKFPLQDFLRLTSDSANGSAFERKVLEEGKRISSKYIRPPHTVDYAVMFLPAESLYSEVSRRRGLVDTLQNDMKILVAGPCTFAALLTSIRMGFRGMALEKRGSEVISLLRGVKGEFDKYVDSIAKARQKVNQLETELDSVEVRARALSRKLRDIADE